MIGALLVWWMWGKVPALAFLLGVVWHKLWHTCAQSSVISVPVWKSRPGGDPWEDC
jgi:hypothetical protein